MDPVSFAFSLVSFLDLCVKYGKLLVEACRNYQQAPQKIREAMLKLMNTWAKIETQLGVVKVIWNELGENLQILQQRTHKTLSEKLVSARATIDGFFDPSGAVLSIYKKLKYALWAKSAIDRHIVELEEWHRYFDPSWFLITRLSSVILDKSLSAASSAPGNAVSMMKGLRDAHNRSRQSVPSSILLNPTNEKSFRQKILYLNSYLAPDIDEKGVRLIDFIPHPPNIDSVLVTRDISKLADTLSNVNPVYFGLLQCEGFALKESVGSATKGFELSFKVPPNLHSPRSLRVLLQTDERLYALQERLSIAKSLARAMIYLHTAKFVHKNLRPETVAVFYQDGSSIGQPFLVGFEKFRMVDQVTTRQGNEAWEQNIYRHPQRQGIRPEEDYTMHHDIYSLGVCLLEIGLWTSFVYYGSSSFYEPEKALPGPEVQMMLLDRRHPTPLAIKRHLVSLASSRLPSRVGQLYSDVVVSCLTCLDEENEDFGTEDDLEDPDEIAIGVKYIDKILTQLESIKL